MPVEFLGNLILKFEFRAYSLGAGFASPQTGIILNNEMADFSPSSTFNFYGLPPSPTNMIQPGKRPLSSMTPAIVVDSSSGRIRLVIGAAGGVRITTSTVYVIFPFNSLLFTISNRLD
jgi:gamma-glutamyltranspeptidase/glutathione hydrolase/leukotriene-C4 hydrolase